ncbi:MAG: class I poly(R)-hydroxyalkanoic acid synthase [Parvibaculum sp.]|jgi:polyhydroxyalkanoate synthase|nr:class I poly(R)-hydroxyalkanoic acid synthase [Parvibaculum sp.]
MSLKETSDAADTPAKQARKSAPRKRKQPAGAKTKAKPEAAAAPEAAPAPGAAPKTPAAETPREFVMPDLGRLAVNLLHAANLGQKAARLMMKNEDAASDMNHTLHDLQRVGRTLMDVAASYMRNPAKIVEAQSALFEGYLNLMTSMTRRLFGEEVPPVAEPSRSDKRFRDPDWQENLIFDLMKQSYLLTSKWMTDRVRQAEGIDPHTREKADFYVRQMANAMSPSNFLFTNPEILRTTLATNGENLVSGMEHLLEDIERGGGHIQIQQTDMNAFRLGENVATTPGKVVYQNDLMQLIQYEPTTEKVYKRPLVIFPPWINKYYILDLTPDKSLVKWCLDKGYTVFVASWVNPDARLALKTFEDYMTEGVYAALDAVEQATGEKEVNAVGYCIGGTLLACSLAHMAKRKDERIKSATFLVTQVDFTEAGELKVFIDEEQIADIERQMHEKGGYLKGSTMATTFNMLRSNDLIWNYVVNNYLLGREPMPFDILFWNSDATRLPSAMHVFYLRECYLENKLAEGRMVLGGETLDLHKVKVPVYLQSSREDHISPYPSVYKATRLFGGPVRFICAGSGHIAGVINPPSSGKYNYWTNDELPPTPDKWFEGAKDNKGSWWPDWESWLSEKSGPLVPARKPGSGKLKVLEDAPGSYVLVKSED